MNIFISYASEQRVVAEEIALALRGEGHAVFFDRSQLPQGEAYDARIREAIAACDLLVFLVSPEAVSDGRYTLTELEFAEQKWPSPAGRVLPVMVRPTETGAIPAYLRAVVIVRPRGNAAAEVAAAIAALSKPRWARALRQYAVALLAVVIIGGGIGVWRGYEYWGRCDQAKRLAQQAQLQQSAGDYAAAWERYSSALATCPSSRTARQGQERLAMDWLDNIRVTEGKETFTDIVNKLQPTIAGAAVAADDRTAADALAHLGWADFLRSRDGAGGLYPVRYYQRAIQRDPHNPYAHAMWGHYILQAGGSMKEANEHFAQALASPLARPYVRRMQIAALLWARDPDLENEVVRVVNDMRVHGETFPPGSQDEWVRWRIWDIYRDRLVAGHDKAGFLAALSPQDRLTTFRWLFAEQDVPEDKRSAYLRMLAQLSGE
ncbi:MAG TPA: toll/interleukin-1 receptor domain-containing protein [Burkholderiales bacterium]|nr:toll/interleukin-1 receptor domain-containing protein [Burkholderiales bacterium]